MTVEEAANLLLTALFEGGMEDANDAAQNAERDGDAGNANDVVEAWLKSAAQPEER